MKLYKSQFFGVFNRSDQCRQTGFPVSEDNATLKFVNIIIFKRSVKFHNIYFGYVTARWQYPVSKLSVVRYEQCSKGVLIQSACRKQALCPHSGRHKSEHWGTVFFLRWGNIACRFVEQYVPVFFTADYLPADLNRVAFRVSFDVGLAGDLTVQEYLSGGCELLYLTAGVFGPLGYEFVKTNLRHIILHSA